MREFVSLILCHTVLLTQRMPAVEFLQLGAADQQGDQQAFMARFFCHETLLQNLYHISERNRQREKNHERLTNLVEKGKYRQPVFFISGFSQALVLVGIVMDNMELEDKGGNAS